MEMAKDTIYALDDRKHDAELRGYDQSDEHTSRFWLNDGAQP
jgi:hypothetical protein